MDTRLVGAAYHHHADGSVCRQYHRRLEVYTYGNSYQVSRNEFKHILHPNAILPVRINKQVISPSIVSTVLAFCFIYISIIVIGTLLMMAMGVGAEESMGCVISSIGNMGPGLGETGPAYSWNALPDAAKWLLSFLMLLGRLELFTVLLLFTPDFWKRN